MGVEGLEPSAKPPTKLQPLPGRGAKAGALATTPPPLDPELAALVVAWPTLPDPIRRAVLALVGVAGSTL